jgi:hypothetical protein
MNRLSRAVFEVPLTQTVIAGLLEVRLNLVYPDGHEFEFPTTCN